MLCWSGAMLSGVCCMVFYLPTHTEFDLQWGKIPSLPFQPREEIALHLATLSLKEFMHPNLFSAGKMALPNVPIETTVTSEYVGAMLFVVSKKFSHNWPNFLAYMDLPQLLG